MPGFGTSPKIERSHFEEMKLSVILNAWHKNYCGFAWRHFQVKSRTFCVSISFFILVVGVIETFPVRFQSYCFHENRTNVCMNTLSAGDQFYMILASIKIRKIYKSITESNGNQSKVPLPTHTHHQPQTQTYFSLNDDTKRTTTPQLMSFH